MESVGVLPNAQLMESVGVLPAPEDILSSNILSLFGILSNDAPEEEEECHFCFEVIKVKDLFAMKTPCCQHFAHSSCFKTWAYSSALNTSDESVRCAYCRTLYPHEEFCFLCLARKKDNETLLKPVAASLMYTKNAQKIYVPHHYHQTLP
jgi:hypothetical protein